MIVIPARIIRAFELKERDLVDIDIEGDRIVLKAKRRPRRSRYQLADLLKQCDFSVPRDLDLVSWDKEPVVGDELI